MAQLMPIATLFAAALSAALTWLAMRASARAAEARAQLLLRSTDEERQRLTAERVRADEARISCEVALADERAARARLESERAVLASQLQGEVARAAELRTSLDASARKLDELRAQLAAEQERRATLEAELRTGAAAAADKLALLQEQEKKLTAQFAALSAEALQKSNQSFLDLAKTQLEQFQQGARGDLDQRQKAITELVQPMRESLDKFDGKLQQLEVARVGAYGELRQQVSSLLETQGSLRSETANLVKALRAPAVRGRWAEIHLKRVVEMAGMLDHCDFYEQVSVNTEDGRVRPDLVVRLPGGKSVVVDAKAPLQAYLEAHEATDDGTRKLRLADHARQVRAHLADLGRKAYWEQFQPAPEFVILFLPNDGAYLAALEHDPSLIEAGVSEGVILATPTTLIAVLRAVAYGWRQERIAEDAQAISQLGRDLHERISTMAEHLARLGRRLAGSVEAYNDAVGSIERRVLPSARKLKDKVAPDAPDADVLLQLDTSPRALQSPELTTALLPEDAN